MREAPRVIVVGAGPVGVVAGIACARYGMQVTLLEAQTEIDHSPRAATTHPSTLEMLAELGLVEEFQAAGLTARRFQFWDRPNAALVAEFDHEVLRGETPFPYVVQTEQHKLSELGIRRLRGMPGAQVLLGAKLAALEQDADGVSVTTESPEGAGRRRCEYLIGSDGARSTVRKLIGVEFEGYTWPERFLVLTTRFDFERGLGCCYRNYFSDPREWTNLFKVMGDDFQGRWRAVFPTRVDESDEEACSDQSVNARLGGFLSGQALDLVVHRNIYRVHQRVAKSFRRGRVFLAGDAAHVNNPVGGLGLNCGIHDAMELAQTLHLVATGQAGEHLLDRYERRRRALNIEFVQQQTVDNKKRLEERDAAVRRANFDALRRMAADPARHRNFLLRTSLIESVRKARTIE